MRRPELVKTRKNPTKLNTKEMQASKWQLDSVSKELLIEPIYADKLGQLYNKNGIGLNAVI